MALYRHKQILSEGQNEMAMTMSWATRALAAVAPGGTAEARRRLQGL